MVKKSFFVILLIICLFAIWSDSKGLVLAANPSCKLSGAGYNYPGTCSFALNYTDLPSGEAGASNAGLSKCNWQTSSGRSGSKDPCSIGGYTKTINLSIDPYSGDCRTQGSKACFIEAWAKDKAIPANQTSYQKFYFDIQFVTVALTPIPSSGTTLTKFSLKADVTGGEGTINYKFDCTNNGSWEHTVDGVASASYTANQICQYASPGDYTARVFVERGLGWAEATTTIHVNPTSPPQANFNCDASLCGPGSSSENCIGYQGCIISANNLSSDPDNDITSVVWVVKDKATGIVKDQLDCGRTLCNYTLPATLPVNPPPPPVLPVKLYTVTLSVNDSDGHSRSFSRDITLRRNISVDFVCSSVDPAKDNSKWQVCDSSSFKPTKGSRVWFSANLDDNLLSQLGLNGLKLILSEGATKFTKIVWKKDSTAFANASGSCQNLAGCNNLTLSEVIQGTLITLEAGDDSGRTGDSGRQVQTQLSVPTWEEISPF